MGKLMPIDKLVHGRYHSFVRECQYLKATMIPFSKVNACPDNNLFLERNKPYNRKIHRGNLNAYY